MDFRLATPADKDRIWEIMQQAIAQRKADGSMQWQDGYPNEDTIKDDIEHGYGYVLVENGVVIAYGAILFHDEPFDWPFNGKWLTNDKYCVVHRVGIHSSAKGRGLGTHIFKLAEELAISKKYASMKIYTSFDNAIMLHILDKLKYTYCGDFVHNGLRIVGYEKILF